jgi:hypothetical protein
MQIYDLFYHLKKCPEDFLLQWENRSMAKPVTEVLVKDLYRKVYGRFDTADRYLPAVERLIAFKDNHLLSIQVACWFFTYDGFLNKPYLLVKISQFLQEDLLLVCELVNHRQWIEDDDRAEEFIRLALKRCDILPAGETKEEASDRLDALDSVKRQSVLKNSNEAIERVLEIRRKMAEQKAREAANAYGRE